MKRFPVAALSTSLSILFCHNAAFAQPANTGTKAYTLEELERFLNGRTTLTVDLKDATLEEVAAAMTQSSGQKITAWSMPKPNLPPGVEVPVQTAPSIKYTLSANNKPFWVALRQWNMEAKRAADASIAAATGKGEAPSPEHTLNKTLGLIRKVGSLELNPDNSLTKGRAVFNWPFLIVVHGAHRSQDATINEEGLDELEPERSLFPEPTTEKTAAPKAPSPEEKRWLDKLVINTYLFADPKLAATDLRCEVTEALDDKGNDLRDSSSSTVRFTGTFGLNATLPPQSIILASKPNMGRRLKSLKGVLHFSIVTATQHWETTQLDKPVADILSLDGGDFKIQFDGVKQTLNGLAANFSATSQGDHLERFWRDRSVATRSSGQRTTALDLAGVGAMQVFDANGNRIFSTGGVFHQALGRRNATPGITQPVPNLDLSPVPPNAGRDFFYEEAKSFLLTPLQTMMPNAPVIGPPAKISIDFQTERRSVDVPFEFKDLPLPPS